MQSFKIPKWYQELSILQMQQVLALREVIRRDYKEEVSERTQKILRDIGITSTFVKIPSKNIKSLHKSTQLDPALFLCEIYRYITGNYFEDEGYKNTYDCNERLVLSAISFLKLPETINELHKRLPFRKNIKFPPKPLYPKVSARKPAKSPYLEPLFERPDWRQYRKELQKWREKYNTIIKPQIILPPAYLLEKQEDLLKNDLSKSYKKKKIKRNYQRNTSRHSTTNSENNFLALAPITDDKLGDINEQLEENEELEKYLAIDEQFKEDIELDNKEQELLDEKKDHEEEVDNVEEIIDIPKETIEDEIIEKNLIIGSNKSESFSNKKYLYGRENLSLKWQEWLNDVDNDYKSLETRANCMLKNVREVINHIYNSDLCDNCCACKNVRKALIKKHTSKTPYLLLDSVVMDENNKTKIIGPMVLNSPPDSLPDSWTNLPQVIPSQDKIIKKNIISGITVDEQGKTNYLISRVVKETLHIPKKIRHLDPPIKNVPPCSCSQHDLESNKEDENKVQCSENGVCIAEKYKSNKLSLCNKCSEDIAANKIFRDFEKACKERENKERQTLKAIDHQTCTQRFFVAKEKEDIEKVEVQVPEKIHPLIKVMDTINQEKMLSRSNISKKSEVKEYKDKIRFAISGVIESLNNNTDENNNGCSMEKYVLSEVTMHTPKTITPEPSESHFSDISISPNRSHHHWSVTQFIPKSKPVETKSIIKPRFRFDVNKWREIVDRPFRKDIEELFEKVRQLKLSDQQFNDHEEEDSPEEDNVADVKNSRDKKKVRRSRIQNVKKKDVAKPINATEIKTDQEKVQQLKISKEENTKEKDEIVYDFSKNSLVDLMKIALQEMAKEGFLLARLPVCYNIPQLRMWIMYRQGFILTEKQKFDLLEKHERIWNSIELASQDKIVAPTITIKEQGHEICNYNNMKKFQAEVELKKKLFYSKVRKLRVLKSREMWNQMEFEKFPSLAFKRAYFVYQPSKEADGHLIRPYGFNPFP